MNVLGKFTELLSRDGEIAFVCVWSFMTVLDSIAPVAGRCCRNVDLLCRRSVSIFAKAIISASSVLYTCRSMRLCLTLLLSLACFSRVFADEMSGGCSDLRKRWDDLVGKPEKEAVETIRRDGERNIEVVDDGTPESFAAIKSGVVRVILDEKKNVKYSPLRQD